MSPGPSGGPSGSSKDFILYVMRPFACMYFRVSSSDSLAHLEPAWHQVCLLTLWIVLSDWTVLGHLSASTLSKNVIFRRFLPFQVPRPAQHQHHHATRHVQG